MVQRKDTGRSDQVHGGALVDLRIIAEESQQVMVTAMAQEPPHDAIAMVMVDVPGQAGRERAGADATAPILAPPQGADVVLGEVVDPGQGGDAGPGEAGRAHPRTSSETNSPVMTS